MKEKKENNVAVLLSYAGSHKGLTFLGLTLSGTGSDRCSAGLDPGTGCRPVRLVGFCVCFCRDCSVFCRSYVHPSGGFPHGGQHPQAGHCPRNESASRLF